MTNEEILQKAIEKAVNNGLKIPKQKVEISLICLPSSIYGDDYKAIIFSHPFLKAFFGDIWTDEEIENDPQWYEKGERWEYHGCKMLLSEDPIKYLESYL